MIIKQLLKELCPNGVEWKPLGEVCNILDSLRKPVSKSDRTRGQYPYYGANGVQDYVDDYLFDGTYLLVGEDGSVINPDKSPVVHWAQGKIWVNNHAHILSEIPEIASLRYLFFTLQTVDVSDIVRGVPPKLNQENLKRIRIPLPPLSIQIRIVEILDHFTDIIANLKTELNLRRKQLAHYLDVYFGVNEEDMNKIAKAKGIEIKQLQDLGTLTRGRRFVRDDIRIEGVPCIHYGDMYTTYGIAENATITFLDEEKANKLRFAEPNDVVIVGAGENDWDIGVGLAWLGSDKVVVHDACYIYKHNMEPKFVAYYLRSNNYHLQIRKWVSSGKISAISDKDLGKAKLPHYPIDTQKSIVSALDKFTALISNIEEEIKLRQKQYEYYREQLLTF